MTTPSSISQIFQGLYAWVDFLWLPIALFAVHRHQRTMMICFVMTCILTLRTQIELMESTGHEAGFLPVLDAAPYARGLVIYGLVIALFMVLAHYSPRTQPVIFFAAGLSLYILAFCFSMIVMLI